jgi:hypothetical protein
VAATCPVDTLHTIAQVGGLALLQWFCGILSARFGVIHGRQRSCVGCKGAGESSAWRSSGLCAHACGRLLVSGNAAHHVSWVWPTCSLLSAQKMVWTNLCVHLAHGGLAWSLAVGTDELSCGCCGCGCRTWRVRATAVCSRSRVVVTARLTTQHHQQQQSLRQQQQQHRQGMRPVQALTQAPSSSSSRLMKRSMKGRTRQRRRQQQRRQRSVTPRSSGSWELP